MSKREASQVIPEESPSRAEKFFKAKRRRQEMREKKEAAMLAEEAALLAELDSSLQNGLIEMPIPLSIGVATGNYHDPDENKPESNEVGVTLGVGSGHQLPISTFSNPEKLLKAIPHKETNGTSVPSVPDVPIPIAISELKSAETKAATKFEHTQTKIDVAPEPETESASGAEPVDVQVPVAVPAPQLQTSS
mmetsp:Transcript_18908/g.30730  ORF Transcript_18908/g.30730 Transcript_18908/m.30730 type:complete len:192 (+) Transcript_18908:90-665(+)